MPRLQQGGSPTAITPPLSPRTGRGPATPGSADPGYVPSSLFMLAGVTTDPEVPDDGRCRMWYREDQSELRVAIGGTKYTVNLTAV